MPVEKVWTLQAGCKVNLYLDIVGVREDGYHELESLFYPLPRPCDVLTLRPACSGFSLTCSDSSLATEENILARVYHGFVRASGYAPALALHLDKKIPTGAGLGGGSSDAAVFLMWLNAQAGMRSLSEDALHGLALTLGADVPFFLRNTPAWVTGIGDVLEVVDTDLSAYTVIVISPGVHVNTKWAYGRWDAMTQAGLIAPRKRLTPENTPIMSLCFTKPPVLWNVFEQVVFPEFPVLYEIKREIMEFAPVASVMSGSGSSFVALFEDSAQAAACLHTMSRRGFVCHGLGVEFV